MVAPQNFSAVTAGCMAHEYSYEELCLFPGNLHVTLLCVDAAFYVVFQLVVRESCALVQSGVTELLTNLFKAVFFKGLNSL